MEKRKKFFTILPVFLFVFFVPTVNAQEVYNNPNINLIVLTPGHTRTITFELHDIFTDSAHASFIVTLGGGTLSIGLATASSIGANSEVVYAMAGIIGTQPVFDYAYSSGSISQEAEVPELGVGILFSAIITGIGNPDFPVTMSMTFSLSE